MAVHALRQVETGAGGGAAFAGAEPASLAHASGLRALEIELAALKSLVEALRTGLRAPFDQAVAGIFAASGRVIVSGIGKSGHIGRKIASTLASTGTPATFIHAAEASHGDLGMITSQDIILALSWSGETAELGDLLNFSRRFAVKLIAITSNPESALGRAADIVLALPVVIEACPHNLAPTSSTTMQLALGDALAMALLESRGFSAAEFKDFHPGGKLSARLKTVGQLMHAGEEMPLVARDMMMPEVLLAMLGKNFGCVGVLGPEGQLSGIVTDGDLRRHMQEGFLGKRVEDVMTRDPITVAPGTLASAALERMNRHNITVVFAVEEGRPAGILHMHDLLRAGVA